MIRTESAGGIGSAITALNDVQHICVSAVPRRGCGLAEQAVDALQNIAAVIGGPGSQGSIVQQAVFVRDLSHVETCRRIIRDFYGAHLPATSYIPQPPCEGKELAIEALGVTGPPGAVEIERCCEQMVVSRHSGVSWIHAAHLFPEPTTAGVYARSVAAFEKVGQMLAKRNVRYSDVVRTWIYLGDIVGREGDVQRYQELNRARTDFYSQFHFGQGRTPPGFSRTVYPASTGIGTDGTGVVVSCIAVQSDRADLVLLPLENPRQASAFDYQLRYGPQSPKFARAMAVVVGHTATIFISGTAAITNSESRHPGDVESQTQLTLDNIASLISADNFRNHGRPDLGSTLNDLALVRVYIKRQEDYAKCRAVCEKRLGERPILYAVADVCRPELLVEIEGMAFCQTE